MISPVAGDTMPDNNRIVIRVAPFAYMDPAIGADEKA